LDVAQLAPDEPLSPELVLVLPPELRARAIATLAEPVWPTPRRHAPERQARLPLAESAARPHSADAPAQLEESWAHSFGALVGARLVQLGVIFVTVVIITLALSLVAQAFR
jgi:hypothetical protein